MCGWFKFAIAMLITLIGSGNVATHIGAAFKNAGHHILQVHSRNEANAAILAYHLKAQAITDLNNIDPATDLFVISVNDSAIVEIARQLAVHQKLIVHTSGAVSLNSIRQFSPYAGVIYPLQTFNKNKEVDFSQVPICIEGSDDNLTEMLMVLGRTISSHVVQVSSEKRKMLHLAAVFACNFSNNLYAIARYVLAGHHLDFDLLQPLILETAKKVQSRVPEEVQTGPAVRRDNETMDAHLQLLENEPGLQAIYRLISQSIIKMDNDFKGNE